MQHTSGKTPGSGETLPADTLAEAAAQRARRLILVTGAPRTATTPVGNMLATARGAASLYEPLGRTGVRQVTERMPFVGPGLGVEPADFAPLLERLAALRLGRLKSQQRADRAFSLSRALFGSRTLHSYRLARLQRGVASVIWKDPHAIMMAADVAAAGVPVVLTVRRALAHAASYKRLGWKGEIAAIYARWAERHGACPLIEAALPEAANPVDSAALLWRMSYLPVVRAGLGTRIILVTGDALEADERGTYTRLFAALGLAATAETERLLSAARSETRSRPDANTTHDWTRSIAAVNAYWRELLDEDEIARVKALTGDVEEALYALDTVA